MAYSCEMIQAAAVKTQHPLIVDITYMQISCGHCW